RTDRPGLLPGRETRTGRGRHAAARPIRCRGRRTSARRRRRPSGSGWVRRVCSWRLHVAVDPPTVTEAITLVAPLLAHVDAAFPVTPARRRAGHARHHRAVGLQLDRDETGAGLGRPVRFRRAALPAWRGGAVRGLAAVGTLAAAAAAGPDDPDRTVPDRRFPGPGAVGAARRRCRPRGPARLHHAVLG